MGGKNLKLSIGVYMILFGCFHWLAVFIEVKLGFRRTHGNIGVSRRVSFQTELGGLMSYGYRLLLKKKRRLLVTLCL